MRTAIFTYGTLRRGQPNYRLLNGFDVTAEAATARGIALFAAPTAGFPYATEVPDGALVAGDLITVTPADADGALEVLDQLEGYDAKSDTGHYLRKIWTIQTTAGARQAWIYLAGPAARGRLTPRQRIHTGDWVRFRRNGQHSR